MAIKSWHDFTISTTISTNFTMAIFWDFFSECSKTTFAAVESEISRRLHFSSSRVLIRSDRRLSVSHCSILVLFSYFACWPVFVCLVVLRSSGLSSASVLPVRQCNSPGLLHPRQRGKRTTPTRLFFYHAVAFTPAREPQK